ncbi:MAG: TMEM165/GDT1 family protein [Gammaproteobacteria bacterium]|nr:TMEM165/GDT1 family protein [Gammaproteobacteria bacterium]MBV9695819.1 TMEM165/GDT1 family protein [Gammaproteobacteria bacterium]
MEALLVSLGVVALAEMGDKTQLLALLLAARLRAPAAVLCGILTATLANHLLAAALGTALAAHLAPAVRRWLLGACFLLGALWMLRPERAPAAQPRATGLGAYGASVVSFFLLEMGDKTQFATVALAARYQALAPVVAGSTLGMLLADAPLVLLGEAAARRLPLGVLRSLAALLCLALAGAALMRP